MTPTTLTADDEELLARATGRAVAAIDVAETRQAWATASLEELLGDAASLTTDDERQEMWQRTAHVVFYLRALEAGEIEAADDYITTMLEIQHDTRRPPYVALHIEQGRIRAFTKAWVTEAMPDLDDEEHAVVVAALLAPPETGVPVDPNEECYDARGRLRA